MSNAFKLAVLDFYNGEENQGMRCIKDILKDYENDLSYQLFDVRGKAEVPELEAFDIFICSGGPGNPLEGDGVWDQNFYDWLDLLWEYNQYTSGPKKHVFFICHSFQMACHHFGVGEVTPRKSMSFGTFPVHQTDAAFDDPIFGKLPAIYYAADFRRYQLVEPDLDRIREMGAEILALEKIRPHVPLERAVMAIRFSQEIVGVQFHPEADSQGLLKHFRSEPQYVHILNTYGKDKYERMITDLSHPDKIERTHNTVLPTFLDLAIEQLKNAPVLVD
ncbi:MAG: GMP synthase [Phaeodactylibacter sp.]|nr:GMP synthase [Phaeodactylibacter sp.]